jgi:hypothetical protein
MCPFLANLFLHAIQSTSAKLKLRCYDLWILIIRYIELIRDT